MPIAKDVTELVGRTPLVYLNRVTEGCGARVAVKLEGLNPWCSVKDRICLNMVTEAEKEGRLVPGKSVIIEPTSGNTGIGLAGVAAVRGYAAILVMPASLSMERRIVMMALGAQLVLTDPKDGVQGVIDKAEAIRDATPGGVILEQFRNPNNPAAHYNATGPEIWEDTEGQIDVFVGGVGTAGTITGVSRYLKEKKPSVRVVAVEPAESNPLSGGKGGPHKIQGIGAGFVPDLWVPSAADEVLTVPSEEALALSRRMAREEGIMCGISAGAAVHAALQVARRPESQGQLIVALLPSAGERYLSTDLFADIRAQAEALTFEPSTKVNIP